MSISPETALTLDTDTKITETLEHALWNTPVVNMPTMQRAAVWVKPGGMFHARSVHVWVFITYSGNQKHVLEVNWWL